MGLVLVCAHHEYIPYIRILLRQAFNNQPDRVVGNIVYFRRKPIEILCFDRDLERITRTLDLGYYISLKDIELDERLVIASKEGRIEI